MDSKQRKLEFIVTWEQLYNPKGKKQWPMNQLITENEFFHSKIIKDLEEFKKISDVIMVGRLSENLLDVKEKVYTRNIFNSDS